MAYHMHHLYHIQRDPFSPTADGVPLFLTPGYQLAWQSMVTGIEERKGIVVLYGESGLGKTTLVRSYMARVPHQTLKIVYLADAALPFPEILKCICRALAHDGHTDLASDLLSDLHPLLLEEYRQNRNLALIIDNAHHLSHMTLADLGLLAGLEQDNTRLIQIVLLGQPALAETLHQQALQSFLQHVAVRTPLSPLTPDESISYIQHRLAQVTLDNEPIFSEKALHHIVKYAGGIPSRLHMLCVDVLNAGLACAERPISATTAKQALADFGEDALSREWSWALRRARELLPRVKMGLGVRDILSLPLCSRVYAFLPRLAWQGGRWLRQRAAAWRPQIKAVLERGCCFTQSILQHSLQHVRGGLRELRLLRIDALHARQPWQVKRRALKAVLPLVSRGSGRLSRQGVLASSVGLLLLVALVWFALQPAREEPPAAVGVTAQPALSVPPLPATTSQRLATPAATASEARLTVERIRMQMQQSANDVIRGGEQIRRLQERLHNAGFTPGPIDGVLGPKTRRALRQFQEAHGLRATGRLNAATRQALGF